MCSGNWKKNRDLFPVKGYAEYHDVSRWVTQDPHSLSPAATPFQISVAGHNTGCGNLFYFILCGLDCLESALGIIVCMCSASICCLDW